MLTKYNCDKLKTNEEYEALKFYSESDIFLLLDRYI